MARWLALCFYTLLIEPYRAVTLAPHRAETDLNDDAAFGQHAGRVSIKLSSGPALPDGKEITAVVRTAEVTRATGTLADSPSVRRLVQWQREFADENDVVREGRDQRTVVFPDALRTFVPTAGLEECASRRHAEYHVRADEPPEQVRRAVEPHKLALERP